MGMGEPGRRYCSMQTIREGTKPFRGIIRHRKTEEYYMGLGRWTGQESLAMEFESLSEVVEEAHKYQIKDCCELIVRFDDKPQSSVYLPL